MKVYDIICTLDGEEYLLGTLFDRDFAEYVCSISSRVYAEYHMRYEERDITEAPTILQVPQEG